MLGTPGVPGGIGVGGGTSGVPPTGTPIGAPGVTVPGIVELVFPELQELGLKEQS